MKLTTKVYSIDETKRLRKAGYIVPGTTVTYDEELWSINGMKFTLIKSPNHTPEDLKRAEHWLKTQRDVVGSIWIAGTDYIVFDYPVDALYLIQFLNYFEKRTKEDTGVHCIVGGFAHAEVTGFDSKYLDISLKWGVKSDTSDNSHIELYKLPVVPDFVKYSMDDLYGLLEDA